MPELKRGMIFTTAGGYVVEVVTVRDRSGRYGCLVRKSSGAPIQPGAAEPHLQHCQTIMRNPNLRTEYYNTHDGVQRFFAWRADSTPSLSYISNNTVRQQVSAALTFASEIKPPKPG